ncbi:MFS general substrate transporter [Sporormia fimetaria CBS 119925]|uniref:MFS general substrate transporter n=1 Tax=Sporormia fimetaria CBS 119925 TaxID=1340428 RepID=A0A6A6UWW2_9PLEO|nr:MFS general substrate transporter [Sporormia fimetaria CBS 119925]
MKTALLVIDMQEYFSSMGLPILSKIQTLSSFFATHSLPQLYTQHGHPPSDFQPPITNQLVRKWGESGSIHTGSSDWQHLPAISQIIQEHKCPVIAKNTYDAFMHTPLEEKLREMNVGRVVVCGVLTDCCCDTTARSAFNRGFETWLVRDATASVNKKQHEAALTGWGFGYGDVPLPGPLLQYGTDISRTFLDLPRAPTLFEHLSDHTPCKEAHHHRLLVHKPSLPGRQYSIPVLSTPFEPWISSYHLGDMSMNARNGPPTVHRHTSSDTTLRSFVTICVPLLLSALEGSITNTALPTISESLNLRTHFSWVATAYLLASTIFQPLYGQLADMFGRKYPMMIAVGVFGAGSAICGWASGPGAMILGRVIQGLGTGGIDLFAEIILSDLVPLRDRGIYMAIKHAAFAVGTTVGPVLGGFFAERNWRWCFWLNIPVCTISFALMWACLRVHGNVKTKDTRAALLQLRKADGIGTLLLTSSVVLICFSLSTGGTSHSWSSDLVITPLVIGILLLIIFTFWERSTFCRHPIMPPHVFGNRTSATALALTAIHGLLTYGIQFFLPPYFQAVKLYKPSKSGTAVLPTTLTIVIVAAASGPLLTIFGRYKPMHQVGFASMALGLWAWAGMTENTKECICVLAQLAAAFGSGLIVPTLLPAVQVELPDSANGAAAGSWAFLRGTGSLFGVAIPSAIFNAVFQRLVSEISDLGAREQLADGQAYQRADAAWVGRFGPRVAGEIRVVFSRSLRGVWWFFLGAAVVGGALTVAEKQVKMRTVLDTRFGLKGPQEGVSVGFRGGKRGGEEMREGWRAARDGGRVGVAELSDGVRRRSVDVVKNGMTTGSKVEEDGVVESQDQLSSDEVQHALELERLSLPSRRKSTNSIVIGRQPPYLEPLGNEQAPEDSHKIGGEEANPVPRRKLRFWERSTRWNVYGADDDNVRRWNCVVAICS